MNLFQFLDIKYQETSIELGKEYSVFKDGRAKAIHSMIGLYRTISKWISWPILVTEFLLMKTGITEMPVSPIKQPLKLSEKPKVAAVETTGNEAG